MSTIYLYIKQHKITGLLYFGKTIQNPEKYYGSGKYWRRHLKNHGNYIDTLCVWEFENQEKCTEFALRFSEENDIIKSEKWANFILEDAIHGGTKGYIRTTESLLKQANAYNEERRKLISEKMKLKFKDKTKHPAYGFKRSQESKDTQSKRMKENNPMKIQENIDKMIKSKKINKKRQSRAGVRYQTIKSLNFMQAVPKHHNVIKGFVCPT